VPGSFPSLGCFFVKFEVVASTPALATAQHYRPLAFAGLREVAEYFPPGIASRQSLDRRSSPALRYRWFPVLGEQIAQCLAH
jgi:hypothetical protein